MPLSFASRSRDVDKSWQAPPFTARVSDRLGYCKEMKETGEQWIQSQRAYKDIPKCLDIISGINNIQTTETRSGINTGRLKRDAREVVGSLANVRPFWGYNSDSKFYQDWAAMMNKVARAVYLESFFDRSLKGALQFSLITGDGYIWPKYTRSLYGRGKGRIKFDYLGALDVLPVQMPRDNDLQEAYIVTISDFVPVAKAHSMFPLFQDRLKAVAKRRYRGTSTAGRRMTLAERFRFGSQRDSFQELYCDINYQYILDNSINTTGAELTMGQENTSWAYKVPYLGQDIDTRDPLTGRIFRRTARVEDCYIYPYRRVMVFNDDVLLYDGPNWDWHGMVPLARYSLDRWAHEGGGLVLLKDGFEFQDGINDLERGVQTVAKSRLRPGLTYDISAGGNINTVTAEGLDPFGPDARVGIDTSGGSDKPAFGTILPEELLQVPEFVFKQLERLEAGMDYQLGLGQIQAMSKLRANIGSESMEKMLEASGPIVLDISRDMEAPTQQVGEMSKYLIIQFMTTARVITYVGEDGITSEAFDYDPESLVPSHMPVDSDKFRSGLPSDTPKIERARHFANNLHFNITPYSMHEITQTSKKLGLIQIKKAGVWISNEAIATAWNIPNYGTTEGNTETEKFWNEKEIELGHAARLKEIAGVNPGQGGGGGQGGAGRPSSFNQSPQLKSKEGGERSTIATSK